MSKFVLSPNKTFISSHQSISQKKTKHCPIKNDMWNAKMTHMSDEFQLTFGFWIFDADADADVLIRFSLHTGGSSIQAR